MQSLENFKNARLRFRWNADPLVLHPDSHPGRCILRGTTSFLRPHPDPRHRAGFDELHRIGQQVRQALAQQRLVRQHREQSAADVELYARRRELGTLPHQVTDQRVHIDRRKDDRPAHDIRQREHILNQAVHPDRRRHDPLQKLDRPGRYLIGGGSERGQGLKKEKK